MRTWKLLLVEDNALSMKLLRTIFDAAEFETLPAQDGAEAMTILGKEKVDLIITDILMPNVDGYYLCHKIRSDSQLKSIPIIVYSGTFTSQSEEKVAKDMGANMFIRKPAPKSVLISAVKELLTSADTVVPAVIASIESFEVMHQYNSSLIDKLEQRNIQLQDAKLSLEKTVEERTRDLQRANEDLQAINEELHSTNEQLSALNDQLSTASAVIQQQAQVIISRKDELLNLIYDTVSDIIFVLDVTNEGYYKVASINKAFETLTGIPGSDVIGKDITEIMSNPSEDRVLKYKQAISEIKIVKWEQALDFPMGRLIGEISVVPVCDATGNCYQLIGSVHNITERKNAERQREFDEKNLHALINNTKDLMWSVDTDFNLITANQPFEEMSKVNFGSVIDKGDSVLSRSYSPEMHRHFKLQYERAFTGEAFTEIEHFTDPVEFWTQISYYPIRKGDEVIGTACVSRDITEQKIAEEKIRESEKRYRTTLETMIEGCQIIDFNWRYVYVNPTAAKQGYKTPEFLIGKTMMEAYPGIENSNLFGHLQRCMASRLEEQFENEFTMQDGTSGWFDLRIQPSPEGLFILSSDITQRKKAEQFLSEYNERYKIVSKATNDAVWDWDIVNDVAVWNHGMQTIFGYTERQIKDTRTWWAKKIHTQDFDRINQELQNAFLRKETNWISQYQYRCANGKYKYVLDRAYIIYREDKPVRMIGAMQDITEVVEYRQGLERMVEERTTKLNEALNKEKELVEMKSKFISIASHEFRTPLSTIALATGFIKKYHKKISSDELKEKLNNIEKQVNHMAYLLDDVLMIGKAEAGKIEVILTKVNVGFFKKLAEEVIGTAGTQHKLNYTQDCNATYVTTSEKLIRNIIINLLTNAIKFSPNQKEVFMNVTCDTKNICITVKDVGMGIPAKDMKNLFTSFSRGTNVGNIEGTGLGLSILKKAVDLLKGTVVVKSKIKEGTEFKVNLPLNHA